MSQAKPKTMTTSSSYMIKIPYNSSTSRILCVLCLVLICFNQSTQAGGKGGKGKGGGPGHIIIQNDLKSPPNVPIYMPIPFPVPMPIPHKPPIANPHHQAHYGSNHESGGGEGEVKKIYILQPMGRLPHSSKGGGGGGYGLQGPVQHMPSPVNYDSKEPPQGNDDYDNNNYGSNGKSGGHQANKHNRGNFHTDEQLKILPIVVIPPIAPMSPIQIPSPHHQEDHHQPKRRPQSFNHKFNDQKSFADYGGSGGGSAFRTRSLGGVGPFRAAALQDSPSDEFEDYDSGPSSSNWRSSNSNRRHGSSSSSNPGHRPRHSWRPNQSRHRLLGHHRPINSIRDIMEQHTIFDDEPSSAATSQSFQSSNQRPCCSSSEYQLLRDSAALRHRLTSADTDRDSSFLDYDYRSPSMLLKSMASHPSSSSSYIADDLALDNEPPISRHGRRSFRLSGRDNQLSMEESATIDQLLEQDDQWRYDSIKSVVHQDPNTSQNNNNMNNHNVTIPGKSHTGNTTITTSAGNEPNQSKPGQASNKLYDTTTDSNQPHQLSMINMQSLDHNAEPQHDVQFKSPSTISPASSKLHNEHNLLKITQN